MFECECSHPVVVSFYNKILTYQYPVIQVVDITYTMIIGTYDKTHISIKNKCPNYRKMLILQKLNVGGYGN